MEGYAIARQNGWMSANDIRELENMNPMPVISRHVLEVPMGMKLTQEQFDRECGYRLARSIMGRLVEDGLLTPKEYGRIEPILAQKFSPIWAGYPNVIRDKCA